MSLSVNPIKHCSAKIISDMSGQFKVLYFLHLQPPFTFMMNMSEFYR